MAAATISRSDFDAWMSDIQSIIFDCTISITNWSQIIAAEEERLWRYRGRGFAQHLCGQYWFTLVTQLAKLYCNGSSHKRSFTLLLARLTATPADPFLMALFETNRREREIGTGPWLWSSCEDVARGAKEVSLLNRPHRALIGRLETTRREATAHTEPQRDKGHPPYFSDLKLLTENAGVIYNKISGGILNSSFMFDSHGDWSILPAIDALRKDQVEFEKWREEGLKRLAQGEDA